MKITTVGIDLAKKVLQIHGVNKQGKKMFNKQLRTQTGITVFCSITPLSDWYGGVWKCSLLGKAVTVQWGIR